MLENVLLAKKRTRLEEKESSDGDRDRQSKSTQRERAECEIRGFRKKSPGNKSSEGEKQSEEVMGRFNLQTWENGHVSSLLHEKLRAQAFIGNAAFQTLEGQPKGRRATRQRPRQSSTTQRKVIKTQDGQ